MNVLYAGDQFMSRRLIEVIQELRDYLGPEEAHGLSDEEVVHKVMCKALEYQAELSTLKSNRPLRPDSPRRHGQLRQRNARPRSALRRATQGSGGLDTALTQTA